MNRRTFTKTASGGTVAVLAGLGATATSVAAQTPQASPIATPDGTVTWTNIGRTYSEINETQYPYEVEKLYVEIYQSSHAADLDERYDDAVEEYHEPSEGFYLIEDVEHLGTYGEKSFIVTAKEGNDISKSVFVSQQGPIQYFIGTIGTNRDDALALLVDVLDDLLARRVLNSKEHVKDHYTDEEMFDLMPTESEAELIITDEWYETGEYEL